MLASSVLFYVHGGRTDYQRRRAQDGQSPRLSDSLDPELLVTV